MTRFSVIVPMRSVEAFADECLWSARRQEGADFEVVVVDDASPDASGEIADRHARADGRVVVLHLGRSGGVGPARNAGIAVARGEYLVFLDGDDSFAGSGVLAGLDADLVAAGEPDVLVFGYRERRPCGVTRTQQVARGPEQTGVPVSDRAAVRIPGSAVPPTPTCGVESGVVSGPTAPDLGAEPRLVPAPPTPGLGTESGVASAPPTPASAAEPRLVPAAPTRAPGAESGVVSAPPTPASAAEPGLVPAPPTPAPGAGSGLVPAAPPPSGAEPGLVRALSTPGPDADAGFVPAAPPPGAESGWASANPPPASAATPGSAPTNPPLPTPTPPVSVTERPALLRASWVCWNKAYRRDFVTAAALRFPPGYYEDFAWSITALLAAERIAVSQRIGVDYRRCRPASISRGRSPRHLDVFDQFDRVLAALDTHPHHDVPQVREVLAAGAGSFLRSRTERLRVVPDELVGEFRRRAADLTARIRAEI